MCLPFEVKIFAPDSASMGDPDLESSSSSTPLPIIISGPLVVVEAEVAPTRAFFTFGRSSPIFEFIRSSLRNELCPFDQTRRKEGEAMSNVQRKSKDRSQKTKVDRK